MPTAEEIVAAKSGPDFADKTDGKFRKSFTIQGLRIDGDRPSDEQYKAIKNDARMDEGNKQATLQEALTRGLHPKGEAELESVEFVAKGLNWTSYKWTYAVPAVPSFLDEDPQSTFHPLDTEQDRRERVNASRLRAAADPAGFEPVKNEEVEASAGSEGPKKRKRKDAPKDEPPQDGPPAAA